MRVICCFTDLHPKADRYLRASAPEAERIDVSGDSEAYYRALRDAWADGETFVSIEQDVLLDPGALRDLDVCQREWCSAGPDLWCWRVRSEVMSALPNFFDEIPPLYRYWSRLCGGIHLGMRAAHQAGFLWHEVPHSHRRRVYQVRIPGSGIGWPNRLAALPPDLAEKVMAASLAPSSSLPLPPSPPPDWRLGLDELLRRGQPGRDVLEHRRQSYARWFGAQPTIAEVESAQRRERERRPPAPRGEVTTLLELARRLTDS